MSSLVTLLEVVPKNEEMQVMSGEKMQTAVEKKEAAYKKPDKETEELHGVGICFSQP